MTSINVQLLGGWISRHVVLPQRSTVDEPLCERVLDALQRRKQRRQRAAWAAAMTSCLLLVIAAVATWRGAGTEQAIWFRVEPGGSAGRIGAYVAPTGERSVQLQFSEGSRVALEEGARARVAETTAHGATVLLESGRARVEVVHRPRTEWTFVAGPYTVKVHGTVFHVGFDAQSQLFELDMESGVVEVLGPGLVEPVEIRGAQRFVHHAGDASGGARRALAQPGVSSSASAPAPPEPVPDSVAALGLPAGGPDSPANASPARNRHLDNSWQARVARGEYAGVIREAESRGLERVYAGASADDLTALANAARFTGKSAIGRGVLGALRRRFAGSPAAASAAFLMGRMVEGASPLEARSWYERYQQEAPSGSLIAEAMGRRMLITRDLGSRDEAVRLAREYMRRFPAGSYAGVARKIVMP